MTDFAKAIRKHGARDLDKDDQEKAGMPLAGALEEEHRNFLKTVSSMIEAKEIDLDDPKTFLKGDVYAGLDQEWKDRTDLALMNIATLLRQIHDFYRSKETPDESPQYQTMIEDLWQMKQRIEDHHDVFKF